MLLLVRTQGRIRMDTAINCSIPYSSPPSPPHHENVVLHLRIYFVLGPIALRTAEGFQGLHWRVGSGPPHDHQRGPPGSPRLHDRGFKGEGWGRTEGVHARLGKVLRGHQKER